MPATTTKLIGCLAVASAMRCMGSAEIADPNTLSAPSTDPKTLPASNTTFTKASEDRMQPARPTNPLGVKHSFGGARTRVSPHVDQEKLKDLQHASVVAEEASAKTEKAGERMKYGFYNWSTPEDLKAKIKFMCNEGPTLPRPSYMKLMLKRNKKLTSEQNKLVDDEIEEALKDKANEMTTEWRLVSKHPDEVFKLLGKPYYNSRVYKIYNSYKKMYYDRESFVRFEYDNWLSQGTDKADVEKVLNELFPGEAMDKYLEEYEAISKVSPDIREELKTWLSNGSKQESVDTELRYRKLSDDEVTALHGMYTAWWNEKKTLADWKAKQLTLDYVYDLLKLENLDYSKRLTSMDYLRYVEYCSWYMDTFPEKALTKWAKDGKTQKEVFVRLTLDSVEIWNAPRHKLYPHFLRYPAFWVDEHLDQLLAIWKRTATDPKNFDAFLGLYSEQLSKESRDKRTVYSELYKTWWIDAQLPDVPGKWIDEHLQHLLEMWKRTATSPKNFDAFLELHSEQLSNESKDKRTVYSELYKIWWIGAQLSDVPGELVDEQLDQLLVMWKRTIPDPDDVDIFLRLGTNELSKESKDKRTVYSELYKTWWTYMLKQYLPGASPTAVSSQKNR